MKSGARWQLDGLAELASSSFKQEKVNSKGGRPLMNLRPPYANALTYTLMHTHMEHAHALMHIYAIHPNTYQKKVTFLLQVLWENLFSSLSSPKRVPAFPGSWPLPPFYCHSQSTFSSHYFPFIFLPHTHMDDPE